MGIATVIFPARPRDAGKINQGIVDVIILLENSFLDVLVT